VWQGEEQEKESGPVAGSFLELSIALCGVKDDISFKCHGLYIAREQKDEER
jgi:hypothetical protein